MAARRYVDVFESYDRFTEGDKVQESYWDYDIVHSTAVKMKDRYELDFGANIVPEDPDMVDNLFLAGVDMLLETGIYNIDLGRVMHIDEDELYEGIKMAPRKLSIGHGKDKCKCKARVGNSKKRPIIQGGPTGAPLSEEIFMSVIESYADEPMVDAIVSGVLETVDGHQVLTNTPWEIKATMAEVRYVREAVANSGRPGMGI
jgi:methylamine--corrinoid protein Co-methyltransferase